MTFVDIFKRECITCSSTPKCPSCNANEECILTTQTCNSCPKTYCSPVSNLNASANKTKNEVGAIAGGVIGGVIVLALVGFYVFYKYYYKPHKLYNKETSEEFKYQKDEENVITNTTDKRLSQVTLSTMALSVFTKASNVIPIAYIPGVTVKYNQQQRKTATPSIYSDIDNASIIGAEHHQLNTTTAIRAKPRLINIDTEDDDNDNSSTPRTAVSIINLGGIKTIKVKAPKQSSSSTMTKYQPVLQNDMIVEEEEEEEAEEEGDSVFNLDIGLDESSPFHNNNVISTTNNNTNTNTTMEEEDSSDDDDGHNQHSIEGLSDDDDYDPTNFK